MKSIQHLHHITSNDEWITPMPLLRKAMFTYDVLPFLDVACTKSNAQFSEFYTDSLNKDWNKDYFCNPPYSKIYDFISYGYEQCKKHNVTGMFLTFAKTDTKWWHEFVEGMAEVHFIKGRIKFINPATMQPSKNSAPYPSCFIIYRKGAYKP